MWDLRLIRERLAALGLDWDQPGDDAKPQATPAAHSPPLEVQVVGAIPERKGLRQTKGVPSADEGQ